MKRMLLIVALLAVLLASSACNQQTPTDTANNPETATPEPPAPAATPSATATATTEPPSNIVHDGVIGDAIAAEGGFDFKALSVVETERYYNAAGGYGQVEDRQSQLGKFIVVSFSITNTSAGNIDPGFEAYLHAQVPDGKVEIYEPADVFTSHMSSTVGFEDPIPPRQMLVSQFVFDVPADVEAETLVVDEVTTLMDPRLPVAVVDLTSSNPQGPEPQEVLALQYEYTNMTMWEQAYDLFAAESKARVPLERYTAGSKRGFITIVNYSFPSVRVEGDRAVVERVFTYTELEGYEEFQNRATQEFVREDAGWRILMRPDQEKYFLS